MLIGNKRLKYAYSRINLIRDLMHNKKLNAITKGKIKKQKVICKYAEYFNPKTISGRNLLNDVPLSISNNEIKRNADLWNFTFGKLP